MDATRGHLDLLTILGRLALFFEFPIRKLVGLEIWFDGFHPLEEVIHIHYKVLDHWFVRERFDTDWLVEIRNLRLAAESLAAVDE
ncbi:hypothetical protein C480_19317 [Natrialba aegyptia DSM 13077]|uniref:Uncharacterized protein n=1 Tax=Natrialba aegyptia DSM 13077 TaxID=1227491 RepID=M0ANH7_9EURY|nr:hypothetical protein C480_19317 [Natrialba aegyptia DSM 13077]